MSSSWTNTRLMHGFFLLHASLIHDKAAGLQKDADDARAFSFLKMLEMLALMTSPPTHLLVENVVGFENSVTHSRLLAVLKDAGFTTQEFILSPLQFGLPYSRPRYFCLAKRDPFAFLSPNYNGLLLCCPGPLLGCAASPCILALNGGSKTDGLKVEAREEEITTLTNGCGVLKPEKNEPILDPAVKCKPIRDFLETVTSASDEAQISPIGEAQSVKEDLQDPSERLRLGSGCNAETIYHGEKEGHGASVDGDMCDISEKDTFAAYRVPLNVVHRWVDAYDIVMPDSTRCCCFTKSYTRYAKGTGSFLATTVTPQEGGEITLAAHIANMRSEGQSLASLGLRYFTPREVANFHSFPKDFTFPIHVRLKQRYALLGNSLSVAVVSSLLKYLFATAAMTAATV